MNLRLYFNSPWHIIPLAHYLVSQNLYKVLQNQYSQNPYNLKIPSHKNPSLKIPSLKISSLKILSCLKMPLCRIPSGYKINSWLKIPSSKIHFGYKIPSHKIPSKYKNLLGSAFGKIQIGIFYFFSFQTKICELKK